MSFSVSDLLKPLGQALSWDTNKNQELILNQAQEVLQNIYDFHYWNEYIVTDNTLYTSTTAQYIDISTLSPKLKKTRSIRLYEDKPENELIGISGNLILSQITNLDDITYYSDNYIADKIYFDLIPATSKQMFIKYKKTLTNITSLTDTIPFSDEFKSCFFKGLVSKLSIFSSDKGNIIQTAKIDFNKLLLDLKLSETESISENQQYGFSEYSSELNDALNYGVN